MTKVKSKGGILLPLLMALFMLAAFVPLMAEQAHAVSYTNTSANRDVSGFPNNYGPVISSDKAEYALGEDIYIKVENSSTATS